MITNTPSRSILSNQWYQLVILRPFQYTSKDTFICRQLVYSSQASLQCYRKTVHVFLYYSAMRHRKQYLEVHGNELWQRLAQYITWITRERKLKSQLQCFFIRNILQELPECVPRVKKSTGTSSHITSHVPVFIDCYKMPNVLPYNQMIAVSNTVKMEVAKVVLFLGVLLTIASSSNSDAQGTNFSVFFFSYQIHTCINENTRTVYRVLLS